MEYTTTKQIFNKNAENAGTSRYCFTANSMAPTTKSIVGRGKSTDSQAETRWAFASCPELLYRRFQTEITMPTSRFLYRIADSSRFACFRSRCAVDEVEDSPFEDRRVPLCVELSRVMCKLVVRIGYNGTISALRG